MAAPIKYKCSVNGCSSVYNGTRNNEIRFFKFPKPDQVEILQKWIEACGNSIILQKKRDQLFTSYRVCSKHFEVGVIQGRVLSKQAVPTLNLFQVTNSTAVQTDILEKMEVHTQTVDTGTRRDMSISSTQTTLDLTAMSPRKLKLKRRVEEQNKLLKQKETEARSSCSKESFILGCDQYLPGKIADMVKMIVQLKDRKKHGRRYTQEFKQYALSLYYMGPKAYRKLIKDYCFPSVRCLQKFTQNIQKQPGLNEFVFRALKLKLQTNPKIDRNCIITMDEMSLKDGLQYDSNKDEIIGLHDLGMGKKMLAANSALVLMARGISDNWKQPLGYVFVNGGCVATELKPLVLDCIRRCMDIGLNVRAVVSDMGNNFYKLSRLIGVTTKNPTFQVEGKKIFYIFDVPHEMKCIRNILMKNEIEFEGQSANWKYIEELYKMEKHKDLKLVPKLTDAHIYPNTFQKMRVKYATQVFSATVASAMSTYVANGMMSGLAAGTVTFIEKMDRLFDILNSSSAKTSNQFKKPYKGSDSQKKFLEEMLSLFKNMKIFEHKQRGKKDVTNKFRTQTCFQISIMAIMNLWKDLQEEGLTELKTRRLNQDCLENFFGKIRQQGGNSVNPTPIQFMNAFRKLSCMELLDCLGAGNCVEDGDQLLMTNICNVPVSEALNANSANSTKSKNLVKITNAEFASKDVISRNVENYISGYVMKKCLERHRCEECVKYSQANDTLHTDTLFTHFKGVTEKYGSTEQTLYGKLLMPSNEFLKYISNMETAVKENIRRAAVRRPGEELLKHIKRIPFQPPCPSFPRDYLMKFFIRMRIYYIIKNFNRTLSEGHYKMKTKRKLTILRNL